MKCKKKTIIKRIVLIWTKYFSVYNKIIQVCKNKIDEYIETTDKLQYN
ncbi:hypothetical protein [Crassaminicella thermophila]|nr:hypothetical protein [Crassaminicella thermophila]